MKHVHSLGIPCFLVIALDDELYDFLHNWIPDHVVRAPPDFIPTVPGQYAATGTPEMHHLSKARIAALRAITEQVCYLVLGSSHAFLFFPLQLTLDKWDSLGSKESIPLRANPAYQSLSDSESLLW